MAEILSEMADEAFSSTVPNPVADEKEEREDTNAVVMEDVFARVRPLLCRMDGSPRAGVAAMPYCGAFFYIGLAVSLFYAAYQCHTTDDKSECFSRVETPGEAAINIVLWPAAFAMPSLFVPIFYRVIAPGGPLEQLGSGKKKVALSQLKLAQRWASVLRPLAGVMCLVGIFPGVQLSYKIIMWHIDPEAMLSSQANPEEMRNSMLMFQWSGLVLMPMMILMLGSGLPCLILWFLSMKVAVGLAQDDVEELVRQATPEALADDARWTATVAQPAMKLATHTMEYLSRGWGAGTGFGSLMCWIIAVGNFVELMDTIRNQVGVS